MSRLCLVASLMASCSPPPHVVVKIEDPSSAATDATQLYAGTELESLAKVELEHALRFPTQITVSTQKNGDRDIIVEARDGEGPLARGSATATLKRKGTPTATVVLAQVCEQDDECFDDLFCDGTAFCVGGMCEYQDEPCVSNFACVVTTCVEAEQRCHVTVDHSECSPEEYCDPSAGCLPGPQCMTTADCDDGDPCNGQETCDRFRCEAGTPLPIDDFNPCTLDGCDPDQTPDPVFHVISDETDGTPCQLANGDPGICNAELAGCSASGCGDGIVDTSAGEVCDQGGTNNSDVWSFELHCNATCTGLAPHCGDGNHDDPDEACDDGSGNDDSWAPARHCNEACSGWSTYCGDDVIETGIEQCDDGAQNSNDWSQDGHCNANCSGQAPFCGDGADNINEACDDGVANSDDWTQDGRCNTTCSGLGPHCGDGDTTGTPEVCDDGVDNSDLWTPSRHCNATCTAWAPYCGDEVVESGVEVCDEGSDNNDFWTPSRHCNATCTAWAPYCGDEVTESGIEVCDDGAANSAGYSLAAVCNTSCSGMVPYCGDGLIEAGYETCDDDNDQDSGNGCSSACQRNDVCGDGQVQALFEQCDDSNGADGDGCDASCQAEPGWECTTHEPVCCYFPPQFQWLPAGTFTMGSPTFPDSEAGRLGDETQHDVTLTRNLWVQSKEVTQGQFECLMSWCPSFLASALPLRLVSWFDMVAYANELSISESRIPCYAFSDVECVNLSTHGTAYMECMNPVQKGIRSATVTLNGVASVYDCEGYRLPTEAEWEYAARSGNPFATYNGNLTTADLNCSQPNDVLDPIAWFCGNSAMTLQAPGQLLPNMRGLYDMLGNVSEWCWDWYGPYSGDVTDPEGPGTGTNRVARGGDYFSFARYARAACRYWNRPPEIRSTGIGGRLVRTAQ